MRYLLLIYSNPAAWEALDPAERDGLLAHVDTLIGELTESGEWIGGQALAEPSQARTVRVRDGATLATDGPYLEAKEHLAGYCIVECATAERAAEIAARWPDARTGAMEVRPILDSAGVEM